MRKAATAVAVALLLQVGSGPAAEATTVGPYRIVTLGLTDADHTSSSGYQSSRIRTVSHSGFVGGFSERFVGSSSSQSAWVYDSATMTTTRVGLFGAAYTAIDGTQETYLDSVGSNGFAEGTSALYTPSALPAQAAWVSSMRCTREAMATRRAMCPTSPTRDTR